MIEIGFVRRSLSLGHLSVGEDVGNIGRQGGQKCVQDVGTAVDNERLQLIGLDQELQPVLSGVRESGTAAKGITANEQLQ